MPDTRQLEAELEVVRLEDELVKAKKSEDGPSRELKDALREARERFREARGAPLGAAQPDTVGASTELKE